MFLTQVSLGLAVVHMPSLSRDQTVVPGFPPDTMVKLGSDNTDGIIELMKGLNRLWLILPAVIFDSG